MKITWNGLGSFTITGKPAAFEVSVVTDPFSPDVGLRFPRTLSAAMVVSSHDGKEARVMDGISGMQENTKPFEVIHAGEYEVQGIFVRGIHAPKKDGTAHTIYRITLEGMKIAFLGALDRKLTDDELEALGDIDIAIIPVGGGSVLTAEMANDVANQIEPRMVIPSYFHVEGLKQSLQDVETFCKEIACPREDAVALKITKAQLPLDDVKVIVLTRM